MNRKTFLKHAGILLIVPSVFFSACADKSSTPSKGKVEQTYTCPMHPQVIANKPGNCPICGMQLVPFDKNNQENYLLLGASQQALANITTMTVGNSNFSNYTRLNGTLVVNSESTSYVSSRVAGRVDQLYVKQTGVTVNKGQSLYRIYSEQLSTLQQEYLVMVAQAKQFPDENRFQEMEKASRQKLLLYGQTPGQLEQLVRNQKVFPYVTYFSPSSGTVSELSITEGQYVAEGSPIMKLEGYNNLWVQADIYPSEANKVKVGQNVKVIISGYEDQPINTTINFIAPALEQGSQIMQARATIPNQGNKWQAGLQAVVLLPTTNGNKGLTLPVDAVIRDAHGSHVWLAAGEGKYAPQMVTTGRESADQVEITSGLEEGQEVVVTGAYLLYSEFVLKKGKNPMAGMKM
ncbi:MAG: efflux RND transporter periplasmic adaptor subunit [Candidatus Dadabacteria bacterium]